MANDNCVALWATTRIKMTTRVEEGGERQPAVASREGSTATENAPCEEWGTKE